MEGLAEWLSWVEHYPIYKLLTIKINYNNAIPEFIYYLKVVKRTKHIFLHVYSFYFLNLWDIITGIYCFTFCWIYHIKIYLFCGENLCQGLLLFMMNVDSPLKRKISFQLLNKMMLKIIHLVKIKCPGRKDNEKILFDGSFIWLLNITVLIT